MYGPAMTGLEKAIEIAGGQAALARLINVKQAHVWYWLNKPKRVPAEQVAPIVDALNGGISRQELRPDLYPPEKEKVA